MIIFLFRHQVVLGSSISFGPEFSDLNNKKKNPFPKKFLDPPLIQIDVSAVFVIAHCHALIT